MENINSIIEQNFELKNQNLELRKENIKLKKESNSIKAENKNLCYKISMTNNTVKQLENKYEKYMAEEENRIRKAIETAVKIATEKLNVEHQKTILKLNNTIASLERRLNINSSNSGIPTSKDRIGVTKVQNNREKSNKPIGAPKGHSIHKLNYFKEEEITEKVEHTLDICPKCGGKLKDINIIISDVIDIEIKLIKRRNNIHNYKCTHCGEKISANDKLPRGVVYGQNVNTIALSMMNESNVALNKIAKHITGISNNEINLSEGYLVKLQKRCSRSLQSFNNELKEKIIHSKYVFWDDTGVKIEKENNEDKNLSKTRNGIIRFYGNDDFALLKGHNKKDKESIIDDGILNNLPKDCICMHDHVLLNYNSDFNYQNAECNQHILRYLKSIKDNFYNHTWQDKMMNLLSNTNKKRAELISQNINRFSDKEIIEIYHNYDEIIKLGYEENNLVNASSLYDKKDELNLIERLEKFKKNHLLFVENFNVAFTNNTSERGLRQCKRKLAVSFLFKNINRMKDYANIISYLETCYRNGISKYDACKKLVNNEPYTVKNILSDKKKVEII